MSYQSALTPIGMRAGLAGRPRAKSMRYRPAFRLYKGQRQCRLVSHASSADGLSPAIPYADERGNVLRLAAAQALAGANSTVIYATGAIVGDALAPSKALATLPISLFVMGMAASTLPAGAIAQRHGRSAAFLTGTGCSVLAGPLASLAVMLGSFWLFCSFLSGSLLTSYGWSTVLWLSFVPLAAAIAALAFTAAARPGRMVA